jgi:hypothetical protein
MDCVCRARGAAARDVAVAALIWYFAQGSIRENLGTAGRWVVFSGWLVLIVLCFVALASLVDCSLRF